MEIGTTSFAAPSRKRGHRMNSGSGATNSNDFVASVRCFDKLYTNRRTHDCALFGTSSSRSGLREEEEVTRSVIFKKASSASKKNNIVDINIEALGCVPCAYKIGTFDVALDNRFTQWYGKKLLASFLSPPLMFFCHFVDLTEIDILTPHLKLSQPTA